MTATLTGRPTTLGLRRVWFGVLAMSMSGCATVTPGPVLTPRTLARAPLCEASAVEVAPWDRAIVLVGDNEIGTALFAMRRDPLGWLAGLDRIPFPAGVAMDDIEALAVLGERIVIVGSHGRSARCERRPSREHMAVMEWEPARDRLKLVSWSDATAAVDRALEGVDGCLEALFVSPPPEGARELCESLELRQSTLSSDRCIPPLDIEAALVAPGALGARVWLGLRQPRVGGRPTLLRLTPDLQTLRFDGVARIEAGDRGLRGATSSGEDLWFILGPGPPRFDRSTLWRADATSLAPGALVRGEAVIEGLLPESEGVVVVDGIATVVIDGDEAPESASVCCAPALQQVIRLPRR